MDYYDGEINNSCLQSSGALGERLADDGEGGGA